ncbi:STAS domain-containing protein [Virgibacillus sp. SK37]|uniref:STAS domain-containing protein n=1 Tax=Virgibacillus sp. SK37 TaxID=403957 RepID=UPI0004D10CAE|nr:STAS domain-containing protein [Virgibacillus sp. SK37]AIF42836.1 anti-sigma factor antagonist [Virgibacillus sp. SK37]
MAEQTLAEAATHEQLADIKNKIMEQKEKFTENLRLEENNEFPYHDKNSSEKMKEWRKGLVQVYADSLVLKEEKAFSHVSEWGNEMAAYLISIDMPLDFAVREIRYYRNLIGEVIKQESKRKHFSLDLFFYVLSSFGSVVDQVVHIITLAYIKIENERKQANEIVLDELTIPVIKIKKGIGVLPLIGEVDTRRAQILMERSLSESSSLALDYLIIDISGVPVVDTMVADKILKVIKALELAGVEVKISGVRPEVAQTMTDLGVDFKGFPTFSTLDRAFKNIEFS